MEIHEECPVSGPDSAIRRASKTSVGPFARFTLTNGVGPVMRAARPAQMILEGMNFWQLVVADYK